MKIRHAIASDAMSIHELHTRSVRVLCSDVYASEVIEGWLEGRSPEGYKGIAKGEMYVVEQDGRIVAWSHVQPDSMVALFVDPEYSGKGLGRALMEHADQLVQDNGKRIEYIGATFNAVGFYEKFGFSETERDAIQKGQVKVPMVHMVRQTGANRTLNTDGDDTDG